MKKIILISFLFVFIGACSGNFIEDKTPTKFPEGRELYKSKCGGCHMLHNRHEFNPSKWDSIMIPMQVKSKISDEQVETILEYLKESKYDYDSVHVN